MKTIAALLVAFLGSACVVGEDQGFGPDDETLAAWTEKHGEAPPEADSEPSMLTPIPDDISAVVSLQASGITNDIVTPTEEPENCATCLNGTRAAFVQTSIPRLQGVLGSTVLQSGWSAFHHLAATAAAKRDCQSKGWAGGIYYFLDQRTFTAYSICYDGFERWVPGWFSAESGAPCDGVSFGDDHWLFCNSAGSRTPRRLGVDSPGFVVEHGGGAVIVSIPAAAWWFSLNIHEWARANMGMDLNVRDGWQSYRSTLAAHDVCQKIYGALGGYLVEYDIRTGAGQVACIYR